MKNTGIQNVLYFTSPDKYVECLQGRHASNTNQFLQTIFLPNAAFCSTTHDPNKRICDNLFQTWRKTRDRHVIDESKTQKMLLLQCCLRQMII